MSNMLLVLGLLAVGYGLRRLPAFPAATGHVLNMFVVHVSLPALILVQAPRLTLAPGLWIPVVAPWLLLALSVVAVVGLGKALEWDRKVVGCLLMVVPLGNTSFLGVPMVEAFLGPDRVPHALLYDQLGSFLALATYGAMVPALYGEGESVSARRILIKVVTFPPFLALLLALALWPVGYPAGVTSLLERVAATLVPVVMVAVGFQLTARIPRSQVVPLAVGLGLKLVAAPMVVLGLVLLAGEFGDPARVSVFEAAMPPMITAGALAMAAGLAPTLASAMVGLGLLASLVTLPLLHWSLDLTGLFAP